jgi:hypothetical protein
LRGGFQREPEDAYYGIRPASLKQGDLCQRTVSNCGRIRKPGYGRERGVIPFLKIGNYFKRYFQPAENPGKMPPCGQDDSVVFLDQGGTEREGFADMGQRISGSDDKKGFQKSNSDE